MVRFLFYLVRRSHRVTQWSILESRELGDKTARRGRDRPRLDAVAKTCRCNGTTGTRPTVCHGEWVAGQLWPHRDKPGGSLPKRITARTVVAPPGSTRWKPAKANHCEDGCGPTGINTVEACQSGSLRGQLWPHRDQHGGSLPKRITARTVVAPPGSTRWKPAKADHCEDGCGPTGINTVEADPRSKIL